jgi:hypothetical protein
MFLKQGDGGGPSEMQRDMWRIYGGSALALFLASAISYLSFL